MPLTPQEFFFDFGQSHVQKHGPAMRACERHAATRQISHQACHFIVLQAMVGSNGGVAGRHGQKTVKEPRQALFKDVLNRGVTQDLENVQVRMAPWVISPQVRSILSKTAAA